MFVPPSAETKYAHPSLYGHVGNAPLLSAVPFHSQPLLFTKATTSASESLTFVPALATAISSVPTAGAPAAIPDMVVAIPSSVNIASDDGDGQVPPQPFISSFPVIALSVYVIVFYVYVKA